MPNSHEPSQAEYQPTPYEDATFEVIGELVRHEDFIPLEVEVLPGNASVVDPMFQDYGGRASASADSRWHLPEHAAYRGPGPTGRGSDNLLPENAVAMTPEQIEQIRKEAFEDGRQQGALETVEHQNARLGEIEQRIMSIISDVNAQESEHINAIARDAAALAMSLSERIIGHTVEINPDYIVPIVQQALSLTGGARVRKIRVSPQDLEFIEVIGVGRRLKEYDGTWKFEADESIRMGCVVETSAGEVDFKLDEAWQRVRDDILKVIR